MSADLILQFMPSAIPCARQLSPFDMGIFVFRSAAKTGFVSGLLSFLTFIIHGDSPRSKMTPVFVRGKRVAR